MELSIDSSDAWASLALSEQGAPRVEVAWMVGQDHTHKLLPTLDHVLALVDSNGPSISAVFVAIGPGTFNGLRVGLATAKGLASALSAPLVGVTTLEVEAYAFAPGGLPVCAIHGAGRDELAVARFQRIGVDWRRLEPEHLTTTASVIQRTSAPTVFCGQIPLVAEAQIRRELGGLAVLPDPGLRLRRAGHLAALGWDRLRRGEKDDPATLQPLYLRRPHITVPKARD